MFFWFWIDFVLRPFNISWGISSAVKYLKSLFSGKTPDVVYQYLVCILSIVTDNCSISMNDRKIVFMTKSPRKNVLGVQAESEIASIRSDRALGRATVPFYILVPKATEKCSYLQVMFKGKTHPHLRFSLEDHHCDFLFSCYIFAQVKLSTLIVLALTTMWFYWCCPNFVGFYNSTTRR